MKKFFFIILAVLCLCAVGCTKNEPNTTTEGNEPVDGESSAEVNAEPMTVEDYISAEVYSASLTEAQVSKILDKDTFAAVFFSALKFGDGETLNALYGENKFGAATADPDMTIDSDSDANFTSKDIDIDANSFIYARGVIGSTVYFPPEKTGAFAVYIVKENNRFYVRAFGGYTMEYIAVDIENYIAFPPADGIVYSIGQSDLDACADKQTLAALIESALYKGDYSLIKTLTRPAEEEPEISDEPTVVTVPFKLDGTVKSVAYTDISADDEVYSFRFSAVMDDGRTAEFIAVFSKVDGLYTLTISY